MILDCVVGEGGYDEANIGRMGE